MCTNKQLCAEWSELMYNRACRIDVHDHGGLLLGDALEPDAVAGSTLLCDFPFQKAAQIQLAIHAPESSPLLFGVRQNLIDVCDSLHANQELRGSLQNLRVDFYDKTHHPDP